jgi:hypothetical protein
MRKGPEAFKKISTLLTRDPRFKTALEVCGLHEATGYRWLGRSQQGDASFLFEWLDTEQLTPFHTAVKQAQAIYYQTIVQDVEHHALNGRYRETFYKGQRQYERDPTLDIWTDEQLQALGMDRYLRDKHGNCIPVKEWHPPPVQLQLAVLAARAPRQYGTRITHDVNQKVALGVTVKPAPVLPRPEVPALPVIDGEFTESKNDD